MSDYKEQTKKNYTEKTLELLHELPPFCKEYYLDRRVRLLPTTQLIYARMMRTFLNWLQGKGMITSVTDMKVEELGQVTADTLAEFLLYISTGSVSEKDSVSRNTEDNYLIALSSYYEHFIKKGLLQKNPTKLIEKSGQRGKKKEIIYLRDKDREKFLDSVQTGANLSKKQTEAWNRNMYRETCITYLLFDTGIRVSELVGLDIEDVDLTHCCLHIRRKGDKPDTVYFSDATADMLVQYLDIRATYNFIPAYERALFVVSIGKYKGTRLGVGSVEKIVKKYAHAAGVSQSNKISPHKLRSTYAMNMLEKTGNLSIVQQQLGHSSISSTVLYANASDKDKEAHRNDLFD